MVANAVKFRIGWFGDGGLGETMIQLILSGRKTATVSPSYDPWEHDAKTGDELELSDKHGRIRGVIQLTKIEHRRWGDFDEALAAAGGMTLEEMSERVRLANARAVGPDEEMRIVHFRLTSRNTP